ncbi:MAG: FtsX-like permease family protein [Clostridiales bacterium]
MIKIILISFWKNKNKLIPIIVQLFFGFIFIIFSFSIITQILEVSGKMKTIANPNTIFAITDSRSNSDCKLIINGLKNNSYVEKIGLFSNINFDKKDIQKIYFDKPYKSLDNMSNNGLTLKVFDASARDLINFEIENGKNIPKNYIFDSNEPIPAIIGNNLSEYLPLNSKFLYVYHNNQKEIVLNIEVIGILSKNSYVFDGSNTNLYTSLVSGNKNIVIVPKISSIDFLGGLNFVIQPKNLNSKKESIHFFKTYFLKYGFYEKSIYSISDNILKYYNTKKPLIIFATLFALLILILSTFGFLAVILASIISRKKEFGIRFSQGATPKFLCTLIGGEIVLTYLFSSLLGSITFLFLSIFKPSDFYFSILSWITTIIFTIIISLIAVIIPLKNVLSLNPISLITGRKN